MCMSSEPLRVHCEASCSTMLPGRSVSWRTGRQAGLAAASATAAATAGSTVRARGSGAVRRRASMLAWRLVARPGAAAAADGAAATLLDAGPVHSRRLWIRGGAASGLLLQKTTPME